jgi:hypothetical protein
MADTRRTIPKTVALHAAGGGAEADAVINQLSGLRGPGMPEGVPRPRLVVVWTMARNGQTMELVDLAHETLLRKDRHDKPYWPTLRREIEKQRGRGSPVANLQKPSRRTGGIRGAHGGPAWPRGHSAKCFDHCAISPLMRRRTSRPVSDLRSG